MFFVLSLALAGLFLIYLEFFLPGAVMAIGGSILLLSSVFVFHMEKPHMLVLVLYLLALIVAVYSIVRFALWQIRNSANDGTVILATDQEGFQACEFDKEMIGKTAVVATDLKPSGEIEVDGKFFQALSEGGYIDKNDRVVVVGGQGSHLIVTRVRV
jgi:membrane-bound serine protease (ClpP class)